MATISSTGTRPLGEQAPGAGHDRGPPLLGVLLDAAVGQQDQVVGLVGVADDLALRPTPAPPWGRRCPGRRPARSGPSGSLRSSFPLVSPRARSPDAGCAGHCPSRGPRCPQRPPYTPAVVSPAHRLPPTEPVDPEAVLAEIEAAPDQVVKVAVTDIDGVLRGKYLDKAKFLSAARSGFGFCNVVFGWDSGDQCYDNTTYTGWQSGLPRRPGAHRPDHHAPHPLGAGPLLLPGRVRRTTDGAPARRVPPPGAAPGARRRRRPTGYEA